MEGGGPGRGGTLKRGRAERVRGLGRRRRRMAEPGRGAEPLWQTPPERLAPPHVYRMAGALGAELRRLSGRFGPEAVAGLVPPVVRLLELLEALVAPVGTEGEAPAQPGGRLDAEVSGVVRWGGGLSDPFCFGGSLRGATDLRLSS